MRTTLESMPSMTMDRPGQRHGLRSGQTLAMVIAAFALVLTMFTPFAAPSKAQDDWSPPSTVYIPDTGHTLDRLFLDLWRNAGGADAFGYPISAEIEQKDGHVVQYLQYARFEYWPEGDADGNQVLVADIGNELRPMTVQRSTASFSANKAVAGTSAAEAADQVLAWLPVKKTATDAISGSTYIEATKHTIGLGFKDYWDRTGGADFLGNPLTEEYRLDGVSYQVFERGQLGWEKGGGPYMVPIGQMLADKYGIDQKATAQGDIPTYSEDLFVEPEPEIAGYTPGDGELWFDVNLSSQYMVVYQGDTSILETYVSTGRPGFDTPTGTFFINSKIEVQDMEGVLGGESYNVPSVPWVMYFTSVGHAIHGAYWHNNFGAVMSHGCINLPVDTAEYLYSFAPIGTRVEIHY